MTTKEHMDEVQGLLENACSMWCPENFNHEPLNVRMMRALLNVNAYTNDSQRVLARQAPIRTEYPLPFPCPPSLPPRNFGKDMDLHILKCSICRHAPVGQLCSVANGIQDEFEQYLKSL